MITITDNAAERLRGLLDKQPGKALRVKVIGGGCSGLQYKLDIDEPRPTDKVFERNGVRVVTDKKSYVYLHGTELDYTQTLMEAAFQLNNPNVKKTCGCGASFAV